VITSIIGSEEKQPGTDELRRRRPRRKGVDCVTDDAKR
jgi:hypothetical protein